MLLPSLEFNQALATVGFIRRELDDVCGWLHGALGVAEWDRANVVFSRLSEVSASVGRSAVNDVQVLMAYGAWTALVTNGPLGSDVGMLPSLAARQLGAVAIRATAVLASTDVPGATILEVYDELVADNPLHLRRSIACADDGDRWVFETRGAPFDFEDDAGYRVRRVRDRFTHGVLERYLELLGVPLDHEVALGRASVLRWRRPAH